MSTSRATTALLAVIAAASVVIAAVVVWALLLRDADGVPDDVYEQLDTQAGLQCAYDGLSETTADGRACVEKARESLIKQWKVEND